MRIPPFLGGHGGSQRAWYIVEALRRLGPVHFVLVHRPVDKDGLTVSLEPLKALCETVTKVAIPSWMPASHDEPALRWVPYRVQLGWVDFLRIRSHEVPRLNRADYEAIAAQLPVNEVEAVFAGRLPSASIVDGLISHGLLKTSKKFVDFDDIMSRFRQRELEARGLVQGKQWRALQRVDIGIMRRAERRIASTWSGVSVCTDEDVKLLESQIPGANVAKVPNVIERPRLPDNPPAADFNVLFVGNLNHAPNQQGLELFLSEGWPIVVAHAPQVRLRVVGMFPSEGLAAKLSKLGIELHANVPSVEPYYAQADAVICPILFGGGTRIKILEAMAYGRPVVSTTLGAEGLDIEPGAHALIADGMDEFAAAIIELAGDPELAARLARNGRDLQVERFGIDSIARAMSEMLNDAKTSDA